MTSITSGKTAGRIWKVARMALAIGLAGLIFSVAGLAFLSLGATRPTNLGVRNGTLAVCLDTPNCVSSLADSPTYSMPPISIEDDPTTAMHSLRDVIVRMDGATVISSNDDSEVATMAFLYGSREIGKTGSDAADDVVEIIDLPKQQVVSIGIRGKMSKDSLNRGRLALLEWLQAHENEYRPAGPLRRMGYNSPFISENRAYFELQIPVANTGREVAHTDDSGDRQAE